MDEFRRPDITAALPDEKPFGSPKVATKKKSASIAKATDKSKSTTKEKEKDKDLKKTSSMLKSKEKRADTSLPFASDKPDKTVEKEGSMFSFIGDAIGSLGDSVVGVGKRISRGLSMKSKDKLSNDDKFDEEPDPPERVNLDALASKTLPKTTSSLKPPKVPTTAAAAAPQAAESFRKPPSAWAAMQAKSAAPAAPPSFETVDDPNFTFNDNTSIASSDKSMARQSHRLKYSATTAVGDVVLHFFTCGVQPGGPTAAKRVVLIAVAEEGIAARPPKAIADRCDAFQQVDHYRALPADYSRAYAEVGPDTDYLLADPKNSPILGVLLTTPGTTPSGVCTVTDSSGVHVAVVWELDENENVNTNVVNLRLRRKPIPPPRQVESASKKIGQRTISTQTKEDNYSAVAEAKALIVEQHKLERATLLSDHETASAEVAQQVAKLEQELMWRKKEQADGEQLARQREDALRHEVESLQKQVQMRALSTQTAEFAPAEKGTETTPTVAGHRVTFPSEGVVQSGTSQKLSISQRPTPQKSAAMTPPQPSSSLPTSESPAIDALVRIRQNIADSERFLAGLQTSNRSAKLSLSPPRGAFSPIRTPAIDSATSPPPKHWTSADAVDRYR